MFAWVVQYREKQYDELYVSSEAFWSMADAEKFIRSRANSPKPAHGYDDVPCYKYTTETGEEYFISEIHLSKRKEFQ